MAHTNCSNEALGRLRKRRPVVEWSDDDLREGQVLMFSSKPIDADPEAVTARSHIRRVLEEAVDGLPDTFRMVFILRDVEGMSARKRLATLRSGWKLSRRGFTGHASCCGLQSKSGSRRHSLTFFHLTANVAHTWPTASSPGCIGGQLQTELFNGNGSSAGSCIHARTPGAWL